MAFAKRKVLCMRCLKQLERIDMARGGAVIGGKLPTLFDGVICRSCSRIECTACKTKKGKKVDAPCSWCGGAVSPAYEHPYG